MKKIVEDLYKNEGMAIYIKGKMAVGIYPDNLENNIENLDNGRMRFDWKGMLERVEEGKGK